ncbi:MAG: peroxiredoxin family protein [Puniceicoccaceae bacterium]
MAEDNKPGKSDLQEIIDQLPDPPAELLQRRQQMAQRQQMQRQPQRNNTRGGPGQVFARGPFPEVQAFDEDGNAVQLPQLFKGKYTVLVTGCLTCPVFRRTYAESEAVAADYREKGVQFFYIYKTLAHPELKGYISPQNLGERLKHIEQAKKELQTSFTWLCDTMDNDVKNALRAGPNSDYLINPEGRIVYSSRWTNAQGLRSALTRAVGRSDSETTVADLNLPNLDRPPRPPREATATRVVRPNGLATLKIVPESPEDTYYVKLRAEAEPQLLKTGKGRLYLGFFPDPVLGVHWNNLVDPMQYKLSVPEGVSASPLEATARKGPGDSDTEPREFWVTFDGGELPQSIELEMNYFGCTDTMCLPFTQRYTVQMQQDMFEGWTYGFSRPERMGGNQQRRPQQPQQNQRPR